MITTNGVSGRFPVVLSALAVLVIVAASPGQTVWYVDDDAVGDPGPGDIGISDPAEDGSAAHPFDAIQEAIDASTNGDEVLVAEGRYCGVGNRDLDYGGRAITVRSVSGPENCVIDCEGLGRGFYFHHNESLGSKVDGLTIANGYGFSSEWEENGGGGILCCRTSPTITNCVLADNHAHVGGGLCLSIQCRPEISNCSFQNNVADYRGGGLHIEELCIGTVSGCRFTGNSAERGGGICSNVCVTGFEDCEINGNYATEDGGGIYNRNDQYFPYGDTTFYNCRIVGNGAGEHGLGGGVYNESGKSTFTNCTIANNLARSGGGFCSELSSNTRWVNCIISGNRAENSAALSCHDSTPTLINCTIRGNRGTWVTALSSVRGQVTLLNTIVWGNTPQGFSTYSGDPDVRYCDFEGGYAGIGNIDVDPMFGSESDSHLASDSPCIDAGTNGDIAEFPTEDMDGNERSLDGDGDGYSFADMGVFEFDRPARHIAVSATMLEFFGIAGEDVPPSQLLEFRNCGIGTMPWEIAEQAEWLQVTPSSGECGSEMVPVAVSVDFEGLSLGVYTAVLSIRDIAGLASPREVTVVAHVGRVLPVPGEFPTIQAALDAAVDGDRVLVADGTYIGEGNKNLDFKGKAVELRGAGGASRCIIDCEQSGRGIYFHSGEGKASVVRGLAITNGSVAETDLYNGGGILCVDATPTISGCVFDGCAADMGGGVAFRCYRPVGQGASLVLSDCLFVGNSSYSGGAIYCHGASSQIRNCAVVNNSATSSGGGIRISIGADSHLNNVIVAGNSGGYQGGGIDIGGADVSLTNCLIGGNYGERGAAMQIGLSVVTVNNCTISGNDAAAESGWVDCIVAGVLEMSNSVVAGNRPVGMVDEDISVQVIRSNIEGGTGQAWFGTGNIDVDPLFVDADGPDDDPDTWEDNDYRLQAESPCIDAGSNGMVPLDFGDIDGDGDVEERMPWDLDGLTRFVDDPATVDTGVADPPRYPAVVDMGAYEFGGVRVGDFDGDYDVDLADYAGLQVCVAGDLAGSPECVAAFDFDGDGVVSIGDFGPFELVLAGP